MIEEKRLSAAAILAQIRSSDSLEKLLLEQLKNCQENRNKRLAELAEKIKAGDTTGDEASDFLALHYQAFGRMNFTDGPAAQYLRGLIAALQAAENEPVLVVRFEQRKHFEIHYSACRQQELIPQPDFSYRHYWVDFGILSDPNLFFDFKDATAHIFSKKWQRIETGKSDFKPSPEIRTISDEHKELTLPPFIDLVMCQNQFYTFTNNPRVVVGCQATRKWLANCDDFQLKQILAEVLGLNL